MGFIGKNLLKVIEWTDSSRDVVVYRFPIEDRYEIMTGSTLVVRESQAAIFVHKGEIADVFMPGTYKLSTENLPFLTKILSLPTGFKSPIKAEVYYVNTKQFTGLKWGTQNPIVMRDAEFGSVRIRGYGTYSFKVENPATFMKEMSGTANTYYTHDVVEQCRPMIVQSITDAVAESGMSILDLSANYKEFATKVLECSEAGFSQYGLKLTNVVVENISLPDEVEKALDEKTKMSMIEDQLGTYTKYQAAQSMRDAAKSSGSGNNLTGLGIGMGAAKIISDTFADTMSVSGENKAKTKQCVKCGATIPEKSKFCPECSAKQVETKVCPNCHEEVSSKSKFCHNCGAKVEADTKKVCPNCGEQVKPRAKFCANCGTKI